LIIKYTLTCKTAKAIKHIRKVFNLSSRAYQLGMKALVCGLWDGKSFIPTAFSVQIEHYKNLNKIMKKFGVS
jgi:hypothetical protein